MDLSKYPIQKILFVAASVIPGFAALAVFWAAAPHRFDWFFSLGALGYRTKVGIVLLASLLTGATVVRLVAGLIGGIGGGVGGSLWKPGYLAKTAPWRDLNWRRALAKVLRDPPKDTRLWPDWYYQQRLQVISLLPEDAREGEKARLEVERLGNRCEDEDWQRWYRYYHNKILFPTEKDFLFELQRGIHFNMQAAGVYVLFSALFVPAVRVWWCMALAGFWTLMLVLEEWSAAQNALNYWSTLDGQITLLSELARSAPESQKNIPFPTDPTSPV